MLYVIEFLCKNYYISAILVAVCSIFNYWLSIKFMQVTKAILDAGMESAELDPVDKWNVLRWLDLAFITIVSIIEISLILPFIIVGARYAHFVTLYHLLQYANIVSTLVVMLILTIPYLFKRMRWGMVMHTHRHVFAIATFISLISINVLLNLSVWVD